MAWTVVIRPRLIPQASCRTRTASAKPFVMHEAQETHSIDGLYVSSFTPMTMERESSLAGAEKATFLAPALKRACTFSVIRKTPVDSQT